VANSADQTVAPSSISPLPASCTYPLSWWVWATAPQAESKSTASAHVRLMLNKDALGANDSFGLVEVKAIRPIN